jgi:uncharacterized membrane protein YdbT with pleckstrin-like domain
MPNDTPPEDAPEPQTPRSHVTEAPELIPGQNYDPRLRAQHANEPDVVHASRPVEPGKRPLSDEMQRRCEESRQKYPHLAISEGEFVILDIKRHPIGLFLPVVATGLIILVLVGVLILYPSDTSSLGLPDYGTILLPLLIFMALVVMGGFAAVWVYLQNQFYLTNESVIQGIQTSLFSRHEQTVSLGSIEDASFKQSGILQTLLNYGTIRLSTEGEETTYRFSYVANPRRQVAVVNDAIENFKNGRPVDPYEN